MMLHAIALSLPRAGKADIIADAPWPERFTALGFEAV
jgi:tRNA pseudouridine32 synthase/23S rRNA pseudouridine746 synthase